MADQLGFLSLDEHFKDIVREHGWWIVLRSFDLTKRSEYWRAESQEAIGGPAWKYNDIIFKGRRKENVLGDVETYETRQQLTDVYNVIFYVVSRIRPKKEDQIIEISPELKILDKPPKVVRAYELFDIKHVESKIDKRLVFSKCYAKKQTPTNDTTLAGPFPVKYIKI